MRRVLYIGPTTLSGRLRRAISIIGAALQTWLRSRQPALVPIRIDEPAVRGKRERIRQ